MFGLNALRAVTNAIRERQRRARAYKTLDTLSPELKKDIGWPSAARIYASHYTHPAE